MLDYGYGDIYANLDVSKARINARAEKPGDMLGDGLMQPCGQAVLLALYPQGHKRGSRETHDTMSKGGPPELFQSYDCQGRK